MPRLNAIDPGQATGKAKALLDGIQSKLGMTPNLMRAMANSPVALEGYLGLITSLSRGLLTAGLREQIALAVAEANGCEYCLAAHTAAGKMVGLGRDDLLDGRRASSPHPKVDTALKFARGLVDNRGRVTDGDLDRLRGAGYIDSEIAEIVANVALNLFSNYFDHVAGPEIDFPRAEALSPMAPEAAVQ